MNTHEQKHIQPRTYFLVYLILMALLAATVGVAYVDLGVMNPYVALGIAVLKAVLVIIFFMHVRYSDTLTRIFVGVGFVWLAILIVLTLADYLTRIGGTTFNP